MTYRRALSTADLSKISFFGKRYLYDLCATIVRDDNYKTYIAECARVIADNTGILSKGARIAKKWSDFVRPSSVKKNHTENASKRIRDKLGG